MHNLANCPFLTELNRLIKKPKFKLLGDGYFIGMSVKRSIVKVTLQDTSGHRFSGTAKCAPTDEFNTMTGFSIAATRAMEKQMAHELAQKALIKKIGPLL